MTNKDLVYLVNAGNDPGMASMSNDHSFPALGVLALGTWLQNALPNLEIIARDGGVRSNEKIIEEIYKTRPGVVGVSVLCTSYQNSLDIARAAKDVGSKVIFGNDHASQNSRAILERRSNVDYVLGAEFGELPLELLVRHIRGERINPYTNQRLELEKIPTLTARDGTGKVVGFDFNDPEMRKTISLGDRGSGYAGFFNLIKLGGEKVYDPKTNGLDIFPIVNRKLYPEDHWRTYLTNYLQRFWRLHLPKEMLDSLKPLAENKELYHAKGVELARKFVTGVSTINRFRGCNRYNDPCVYCDISDLTPTRSTAEKFWQECETAHDEKKINVFYECCDSLSSFPRVILDLAKAKPKDLSFDPKFFVYCQARDLVNHPDRVLMLKDIGVYRVNMGLDSMSDPTLKCMKGERDSKEINNRAVELCNKTDIKVYASFPLGCSKETPQTLEETANEVCKMLREGKIADAESQPYLPLRGNDYGRRLVEDGLWIVDRENPDWPARIDLMAETAINSYSGVTYKQVLETVNRIREAAKISGANFGSGVSSEKNYR